MRTTFKLILIAVVLFILPITAANLAPGGSMQKLIEAEKKLGDNIKDHETHVEGPYTKALLNEMMAVGVQISDVMVELGCPDKKKDPVCIILYTQAMGLTTQIAFQNHMWHEHAQDQDMKGMAHFGPEGGNVVFEMGVMEDAGL